MTRFFSAYLFPFLRYILVSFFLCVSSASVADDQFQDVSDPLESMNRAIYEFNLWADKLLMRPITKSYRAVFPKPVRQHIHNVFDNLKEPITILNASLQGNPNYAITALGRFMINSTFGVGGLFKVVKTKEARVEDFGQTLGYYGVKPGPYLMLPILGPSNTCDGLGLVADLFSEPWGYMLSTDERLIKAGASGINTYDDVMDLIDEIELTSLDPYATYRSMFSQYRANQISNGK